MFVTLRTGEREKLVYSKSEERVQGKASLLRGRVKKMTRKIG